MTSEPHDRERRPRSGDGPEDDLGPVPAPGRRPARRYVQASPPAHGGIRRAGGSRPWAVDETHAGVLERLELWATRTGWLIIFLAAIWMGGHLAVSLF